MKGGAGVCKRQWLGQKAKETGRRTRWPKFLSCLIRDISDLFLLPAIDPNVTQITVRVKGHAICIPLLTDIHTTIKEARTGSAGSRE